MGIYVAKCKPAMGIGTTVQDGAPKPQLPKLQTQRDGLTRVPH